MKNKVLMGLLSFVIASGLWIYVVTVVSPESEATFYNVPVVLSNESVLNEKGLMIVSDSVVSDEMMANEDEIVTTATLLNMIAVYLVLAVIGTTIAICLLVWMSKNEGRQPLLIKAWGDRKVKEGKVISVPFVIGVVISILFMVLEFIPW